MARPPAPTTDAPRTKRAMLVADIADALLAAGVAQIPLRDLATLLGTSDRMLLYYFETKADLVAASLGEVAARLDAQLSGFSEPLAPEILLARALTLFASPEMAPVMRVWADLSARGSRGEAPFAQIARGSIERWAAWLEARLAIADPAERQRVAITLLTVIEGARMVEAALPGVSATVAQTLAGALYRSSSPFSVAEVWRGDPIANGCETGKSL